MNFSNRPIYRRRRRVALLIVVLLVLLLVVVLFLIGRRAGEAGDEQAEQVEAPSAEQTNEQMIGEEETVEEGINE